MLDFKDKTVLITGGSRGIGAATVKLFAQLNASVVFNYHKNKTAAEKLLHEIEHFPGTFTAEKCDVGDPGQVKFFVAQSLEKYGQIDILVNNAGIWEYGAIDSITIEEWQRTIRINLDTIFYITRLIVAAMKASRIQGKIINIASTAGQRGEAYHSHYAASKGAIISFTKSLATELGPDGIRVNCVAPGWVDTDMSHEAILQEGAHITDLIPLGYIPAADELAGPIVFLASEWATAITGEILNVNSGSVLCG